MKTMIKIALTFILVIGLSVSSATAGDGITTKGGEALTISSSTTNRPSLVFTPSGNTLMAAAATADDYYIASASVKTTAKNGLEYCMISGFNGYYQKAQTTDGKVAAAGTVGKAPEGWEPMGGAEDSTDSTGSNES